MPKISPEQGKWGLYKATPSAIPIASLLHISKEYPKPIKVAVFQIRILRR
jgi:hypothetical protein